MIIMERLETILGNLGLDGARADVFAYLARQGKATMKEIYEDTPLSRKAISMALEALEAEGTVEREGESFAVEDVQRSLMALLPVRYEELKAEIYSYKPLQAGEVRTAVKAIREMTSAVPSFAARNIDAAVSSVDVISPSLAWLDDESLNAADRL